MNVISFLYVFVLFFILSPGIVVTLPPKSSKMIVAIVHGLIFTLILALTYSYVAHFSFKVFEGLKAKPSAVDMKAKPVLKK